MRQTPAWVPKSLTCSLPGPPPSKAGRREDGEGVESSLVFNATTPSAFIVCGSHTCRFIC